MLCKRSTHLSKSKCLIIITAINFDENGRKGPINKEHAHKENNTVYFHFLHLFIKNSKYVGFWEDWQDTSISLEDSRLYDAV